MSEFSYNFFPMAFDLEVTVESLGWEVSAVYVPCSCLVPAVSRLTRHTRISASAPRMPTLYRINPKAVRCSTWTLCSLLLFVQHRMADRDLVVVCC